MPNEQQTVPAVEQPLKIAANDPGARKFLDQYRRFAGNGGQQYTPFDWVRVALEEGVKPRP